MNGDLRIVNARIFTANDAMPWAESLLITRGRIDWIGNGEAPQREGAETIDLDGRLVLPGLTDAHVHFYWYARTLANVDLAGVASLEQALSMLSAAVRERKPGEWVVGDSYDHNIWGLKRELDKRDLDAIAPDHPVVVTSKCGHTVWANSMAMALAGVDRDTPEPPGSRIERDAQGEPSGLFREEAMGLMYAAIPPLDRETGKRLLRKAMQRAHAFGLTGIHNCERSESLSLLAELARDGELTLRVLQHYSEGNFDAAVALGVNSGFGSDYLRMGGLKLFIDGALGVQTALMDEPFCGSEDTGIQTMPEERLRELVHRAAAHGIGATVHAIGDKANRMVLDIMESAAAIDPKLRHRIEHAQLLTDADVIRFAELGVTASMQPTHLLGDMDLVDKYWGPRGRLAYAFGSVLRSGGRLAFGSDCPVETMDPVLAIHAAVSRQRIDGQPEGGFYPEEKISVAEAVKAYTSGPAYAGGQEADLGSLEVGKFGDLVVLDKDIFALPENEIHSARPVLTVVGGTVRYRV
jgi:predicted amidohydrolase YtcJ